jgi:uncharacterized protein YbcI
VPEITGEMLSALSSEMMRLKAQHYGKGPEEAKTYVNGDFLFVIMRGGMTQVEQTLVEAGDSELVRSVRLRFQQQMAQTFRAAIERIVKRKVIGYESQVLFEPDYAIEIVLLSDDPVENDLVVGSADDG